VTSIRVRECERVVLCFDRAKRESRWSQNHFFRRKLEMRMGELEE